MKPDLADFRYPVGALKTLDELEPFDCRYPIGVEAFGVHLFCAEPCVEGRSYCAIHMALCYSRSPRQTARDLKIEQATMRATLRKEKAEASRLIREGAKETHFEKT